MTTGAALIHGTTRHPGSLLGRDALLAAAVSLLADPAVRLVTLSGPGGVGKTTVARALAKVVADGFPDGVGFAELAAERDPGRLLVAVVQSLGLDPLPGEPPLGTLVRGLPGPRLIVLDNLEHLLGASGVVHDLLTACPVLTVLATSRSRLGIPSEHELAVPPLALPDPGAVPLVEIAASPAVQLFLRRARRANAAFTLSAGNAQDIAEVCRRLDGVPLALELGAARTSLLSAEALLARLGDRLDLLSGGPGDAAARHQSMRDAIDWSVDLLEPRDRTVFAALSVFPAGCRADDLAAVVAALDAEGSAAVVDVPRAIRSLLDWSLLTTVGDTNGDGWLTMLESIRDVAAEHLAGDGLTRRARAAHAARYRAVAERDGPVLRSDTVTQNRMWDRLDADMTNVRTALVWFLETGDATSGLRLVAGLDWFWTASTHLAEGIDWIRRLVSIAGPDVSPDLWGRSHLLLALLLDWLGDDEGTERAALCAVDAFTASGSQDALVEVLLIAASAALERGDLDRARHRCEAVLAIVDGRDGRATHVPGIEVIGGNAGLILGLALALQGETNAAAARVTAAIDRYHRAGEVGYIPAALDTLAFVRLRADDLAAATAGLKAALEAARPSVGEGEGEGQFLRSIFASVAQLALRVGEPEVAARLFAAAEAEQRRTGVPTRRSLQAPLDAALVQLRVTLGEPRFQAEWAIGVSGSQAEQIALADGFLRDAGGPPLTGLLPSLTPRELDVLRLVATGRSNREIGDALFISPQTASKHVSNLLGKLGAATRTAAATYAAEHGLRLGAETTGSSR